MLFSEPKIPQLASFSHLDQRTRYFSALQRAENSSMRRGIIATILFAYFSALQRAENSSITAASQPARSPRVFQCSSASRKFLNRERLIAHVRHGIFQCSSASRKFLNVLPGRLPRRVGGNFSALQRAENSSICRFLRAAPSAPLFQCSSASRKFLNPGEPPAAERAQRVGRPVSEPKIPQSGGAARAIPSPSHFSALQRAENSSIFRGGCTPA